MSARARSSNASVHCCVFTLLHVILGYCRLLVPDKVGVADSSKALASGAAVASIQRLDSLGVKYRRPLDYYAEMVKTDYHMDKVRRSLLSSSCELQ